MAPIALAAGASLAGVSLTRVRTTRSRRQARAVTRAVATETGIATEPADGARRQYRVLVTGSTKGLGLALARRFLEAGDRVLVGKC